METESSILVCFAVPEEARPFRRLARPRTGVDILLTGIGQQNARNAIHAACATRSPRLVLSCGFAGALRPGLAVGAVVFDADPDFPLVLALRAAGAIRGRFLCADHVLATAKEKQAARGTSGADAVEMESDVIRRACLERGIASATVRVISDVATEDLPLDFNQLMTAAQRVHYGKLVAALLKSPAKIGALLRLQRQCQVAAEGLARVLLDVIPSPS